jgi:hypothetical protein
MTTHGPTHQEKIKAVNAALKAVNAALKDLEPCFAQAGNVHSYTGKIGAQHRLVQGHQDSLLLRPNDSLTLDVVLQDIVSFANSKSNIFNIKQLTQVLNTIKKQGASIEPETQANIPTLLRRTWHLAKMAPYSNSRECVIENLIHNISAGGGCPAGISARLIQPYLSFFKAAVEGVAGAHAIPSKYNEEEAVAIALSASLGQPKYNDEFANDDFTNDDFTKALSASLEQQVPDNAEGDDEFAKVLAESLRTSDLESAMSASLEQQAPENAEGDDELTKALSASLKQAQDNAESENELAKALAESLRPSDLAIAMSASLLPQAQAQKQEEPPLVIRFRALEGVLSEEEQMRLLLKESLEESKTAAFKP